MEEEELDEIKKALYLRKQEVEKRIVDINQDVIDLISSKFVSGFETTRASKDTLRIIEKIIASDRIDAPRFGQIVMSIQSIPSFKLSEQSLNYFIK